VISFSTLMMLDAEIAAFLPLLPTVAVVTGTLAAVTGTPPIEEELVMEDGIEVVVAIGLAELTTERKLED
jgi:hypothetical protein